MALHYYAAEYYRIKRKALMYRAIDGSGLLSLGILVEELIEELLGCDGELQYAEPLDEEDQEEQAEEDSGESDAAHKSHKNIKDDDNAASDSSSEFSLHNSSED
jgi:hypothetical protein